MNKEKKKKRKFKIAEKRKLQRPPNVVNVKNKNIKLTSSIIKQIIRTL